MNCEDLIQKLGERLNLELILSPQGTCRVQLDEDIVDFEKVDEALYIMADVGSSEGREDAYLPLLVANNLRQNTGGGTIGIDAAKNVFTMTYVEGDVSFEAFEVNLMRFLQTLRWWKAWLLLSPESTSTEGEDDSAMPFDSPFNQDFMRI